MSCVCNEKFRTAEDYRDHLPCLQSDIVLIANEILLENAADPGNTRIERLARFVVKTYGK